MLKTMLFRILMFVLVAAGLGGCVAPRGYYSGAYVYSGPQDSGAYFNYWYYPGLRVYYDVQRHIYFYPRNGGWVRTRELPPPMKDRLGHHVTIHSRHERPYLDDSAHRREYPARRYTPPAKKIPDQYRYRPQYDRDRYDSRRDERRDDRRNDRRDERRDDRRDDRRDTRDDRRDNRRDRYYHSAPDKGKKQKDKKSSHDKGKSKKSDRYDRERRNDKSRGYDQYDQNQQAPSKY